MNWHAYDALDRLVSWYDPSTDATTTYGYDAAFNLTSVSVDGSQTASFTFDDADRISSAGFSYDDAGNMTSDGDLDHVYDAANRLTVVRDASSEETIAVYAYDHMNRRVSATEGTATTYFHHDGASPNVIAETDGNGGTIATYSYDAGGRLHSMTRGGETYCYIANAHGDVVAMTDESGQVVNKHAYDPWGDSLGATEAVANPYRYAGYRYDSSTGLYYCWNRYYDPGTYRFVTRDIYPGELAAPATMNAFAYGLGNPANASDPSGLYGWRSPWPWGKVQDMVSRTLDAGYGLVHQSPLSGSRSFDDASVTLDVRRWTDSCQACHFDEIEIIWSCDVLTAGSSRPLRIRVSGVPRLGGDIVDLSGWVSVDGTGRYSVVKVEGQNFSAVVVEVEGHEALLRVNIP